MKIIFPFCFLFAFLLSCQSGELKNPENEAGSKNQSGNPCGVSNPLEELAWLKEWQKKTEVTPENPCALYTITQGNYKGQTVFIIGVGGPLCDTCAGNAVYNCKGEQVFVCNLEEQAKISDQKVIWEKKQE
ncbi:hypothetical protein GXP67_04970 [Rhodocytophaga rosea]|uniref:Lipoprotein n=1 Tax=Rhodocytophaga rosea TaxID=2704465 RepID=A0A6C0GE51_9BACT|nr:hypothetical protein [Rhodocytophaga rosea]QHT66063.1 hypothetical protein GXP67_04970 [Rhodocytophaga rosea]